MKRAIAGRKGRGSPPLPRQRAALRIVQVTLVAIALMLALLAFDGWSRRQDAGSGSSFTAASPPPMVEIAALGAVALLAGGAALAMGLRLVRGPRPPSPT